jgi:hypothetical protein
MLEEDILVAKDFFRFHRAAHLAPIQGLSDGERAGSVLAVSAYNSEHSDRCDDDGIPLIQQNQLHSEVQPWPAVVGEACGGSAWGWRVGLHAAVLPLAWCELPAGDAADHHAARGRTLLRGARAVPVFSKHIT